MIILEQPRYNCDFIPDDCYICYICDSNRLVKKDKKNEHINSQEHRNKFIAKIQERVDKGYCSAEQASDLSSYKFYYNRAAEYYQMLHDSYD